MGENGLGPAHTLAVAALLVLTVAGPVAGVAGTGATARQPTIPGTVAQQTTATGNTYVERNGSENPFEGLTVSGTQATGDFVVGDFDGDGDADLLAVDGSTERYYEQASPGEYVHRTGSSDPFRDVSRAVGTRTRSFVADVDGDDHPDLVTFEPNSGGTGTFRYVAYDETSGAYERRSGADNPFDGITVSGTPGGVDAVLGDFDGDDDPDLLAFDGTTERYFENDAGSYRERTGQKNPFEGISESIWTRGTTLVRDFDADGDPDVAWTNGQSADWRYVENVDSGGFQDRSGADHPLTGVEASATNGSLAAVADDFDGDGETEILTEKAGPHYYDLTAAGEYSEVTGSANPFAGVDPAFGVYGTTVTADLDADTDRDVVWFENGSLRYVERRGESAPPGATNDTYSVVENTTLTVSAPGLLGNDDAPGGGALTAALGDSAAHGTVDLQSNGSITYAPNDGFTGQDSFTYEAIAGNGESDTATVTITVTASQPRPANVTVAITGTNAPVTEGETLSVTASVTNVGGSAASGPVALEDFEGTTVDSQSIALAAGAETAVTLSWPTGEGDAGSGSVTVHTDNNTARSSVTVEPSGGEGGDSGNDDGDSGSDGGAGTGGSGGSSSLNEPPDASDDTYTVTSGTTLSTTAEDGILQTDTDPDDDRDDLSTTIDSGATNGTLALAANGSFTYVADPGFTGTDSFTYEVSDGDGGTDTGTVTITVLPETGGESEPTSVARDSGVREREDTPVTERSPTSEPAEETTGSNGPGFGIVVAIVSLLTLASRSYERHR